MGVMDTLKAQANALMARNAARLAGLQDGLDELGRIYPEEKARSISRAKAGGQARAEDNIFDAERHARASQRLTRVVGPGLAALAGYGVEAAGLGRNLLLNAAEPVTPGLSPPSLGAALAAARMDLRNNAEGRRAAVEGRAIDPRELQATPDRAPEYSFLYDERAPRYRTTASR